MTSFHHYYVIAEQIYPLCLRAVLYFVDSLLLTYILTVYMCMTEWRVNDESLLYDKESVSLGCLSTNCKKTFDSFILSIF